MLRNAGGVITDDVIRSLALSQRKLGTREVMLIHHDECGLAKVTDDGFRAELLEASGVAPAFAIESFTDVEADVRQSILRVRRSRLPPPHATRCAASSTTSTRTRCARWTVAECGSTETAARGRAAQPARRGGRLSVAEVAPYGSWRSPIAPADLARGGRRLGGADARRRRRGLVGRGPAGRGRAQRADAAPGGRRARRGDAGRGQRADPRARVRRRRLEAARAGARVYVDFADQRVYRLELGGEPVAITPEPDEPAALRYADFELDPGRQDALLRARGPRRRRRTGEPDRRRCRSTARSPPRWSPRATTSTPRRGSPRTGSGSPSSAGTTRSMPWDGTELWVTPVHDPGAARPLAAGARRVGLRRRPGTPTTACASSPIATAGGTSTGRSPTSARPTPARTCPRSSS